MADTLCAMSQPPKSLGRNYSFHFLWTSTFASGLADRLAMLSVQVMLCYGVALEVVPDRLPNASIVAGINFFFFLPYVLWGPFAGWLADVLPRKWLMFVSDEVRGLIILFAYTLIPENDVDGAVPELYEHWVTVAGFDLTHTWKVWGLMFCIGLFAATFSPARNSIIPNVVGYHVLQRANAVIVGMGVIGNLLGFLVGGPLSENFLRACILTSALAYLVPGFMWPFLKTPVMRHAPPGGKKLLSPVTPFVEVFQGARYVLRHRPLLVLTGVGVIFFSGAQIVLSAGSAIVVDLYGGMAKEFAYIGGAFGLGMLMGAVSLGFINSRLGGELLIVVGMIGSAIFLSLLVSVPVMALGIALAICCGYFGGLIMITIKTMLQQLAADGFRGRVMAFHDLAADTGTVIVAFIIWRLPDADKQVLYAAHGFSLLLVGAAVFGIHRYVLRGPLATKFLNLLWRINRLYCQAFHRVKFVGAHRVPRDGGVLIVSNHNAGIDPLLIQAALPRRVRWLMARDMMVRAMRFMWRALDIIPVHRDGNDRAATRTSIEALRDGEAVGIFPEGRIVRDPGDPPEFQPGLALIAHKADAPIVPVYVSGTPQGYGPWGALLRLSHATVTFGQPVSIGELEAEAGVGDENRHEALTEAIRRRVFALAEGDHTE